MDKAKSNKKTMSVGKVRVSKMFSPVLDAFFNGSDIVVCGTDEDDTPRSLRAFFVFINLETFQGKDEAFQSTENTLTSIDGGPAVATFVDYINPSIPIGMFRILFYQPKDLKEVQTILEVAFNA